MNLSGVHIEACQVSDSCEVYDSLQYCDICLIVKAGFDLIIPVYVL